MILIIGGSWQGKLDYGYKLLGISTEEIRVGDGQVDDLESLLECQILNGYHSCVKRLLESGKSVEEFTERLLQSDICQMVISDEIGSGVVPISKEDRNWRDETGWGLQKIAANATEVYQVLAGLGRRIK